MLENQARDPEVSLKSILGDEKLVLNFRPTDKSKHMEILRSFKKRNNKQSITQ